MLERRRRLRRRRAPSRSPTASGCASTRDGEPRRPHHGPDQRRRLPAAGRRLAARGRVVRQVPRRQPDQRRRRRRALRPPRGDDHAHGRGPVRRVPPRRAARASASTTATSPPCRACPRRSRSARSSRPTTSRSTSTASPKAPDMEIRADELDYDAIRAARVFWVTVTGLSDEPSRERHARRARGARQVGHHRARPRLPADVLGVARGGPRVGRAARSST